MNANASSNSISSSKELPLEIWQMHILPLLNETELTALLLCSRYFFQIVTSSFEYLYYCRFPTTTTSDNTTTENTTTDYKKLYYKNALYKLLLPFNKFNTTWLNGRYWSLIEHPTHTQTNNTFIFKEYLKLNHCCWIDTNYTVSNLLPGRYLFLIRLKIEQQSSNLENLVFRVYSLSENKVLSELPIRPLLPILKRNHWSIYISEQEFQINDLEEEVCIEMKEYQDPWWKSGLCLEYCLFVPTPAGISSSSEMDWFRIVEGYKTRYYKLNGISSESVMEAGERDICMIWNGSGVRSYSGDSTSVITGQTGRRVSESVREGNGCFQQ